MRILFGVVFALLAACSLPSSAEERTWCQADGQLGALLLAADELGLVDEVIEAHGDLLSALEAGQAEASARNAYYSTQAVIQACRLAYDREKAGGPFVSPR